MMGNAEEGCQKEPASEYETTEKECQKERASEYETTDKECQQNPAKEYTTGASTSLLVTEPYTLRTEKEQKGRSKRDTPAPMTPQSTSFSPTENSPESIRTTCEEEVALEEVQDILDVVEDILMVEQEKREEEERSSKESAGFETKRHGDDEQQVLVPNSILSVPTDSEEQDLTMSVSFTDSEGDNINDVIQHKDRRGKIRSSIHRRLGEELRRSRQRLGRSLSALRMHQRRLTGAQGRTPPKLRRRPQIDLGKHPAVVKTRDASRRLITGNKETRIRDYVVLPSVVRVLDRYTFTLGVMGMVSTEFVMLEHPPLFRYYFVAVMTPLLVLRYVMYHRSKWQYFLLDFCYWVNGLCFILVVFSRLSIVNNNSEVLWQMLFVCANGPLLAAVVAWNNSLVFHSVEKVTSVYVHVLPAFLTWCERWHGQTVVNANMGLAEHLGYPALFYVIWQVVYLFQTEVLAREKLDQDPEISTSLRWIAASAKSPMNRVALTICRWIGVMGRDETFHPPTEKVKLIFVTSQFIFTATTFIPIRLLYGYYHLHSLILVLTVTACVWNGARYYIQVFSKIHEKRYSDDTSIPPSPPRGEPTVSSSSSNVKKII